MYPLNQCSTISVPEDFAIQKLNKPKLIYFTLSAAFENPQSQL